MSKEITNILLVGVGGQGIILSSEIISDVAMLAGNDVKKSEVHGMSQRGGSVTSHIRYGAKVYSPLIRKGEVDLMLAFEKLEALRYSSFLSSETKIIVNNQEIYPTVVSIGKDDYPRGIIEDLRKYFKTVVCLEGLKLAEQAGNIRTVNSIILGCLSNYLDFEKSLWQKVISDKVPIKTVEVNLKAFELGRQYENK